jgi:hypothetical protein
MLTIHGTIMTGLGGAGGNLEVQLPRIAERFPEVKDCFHGTINIQLEKPLLVLSADHRTGPIDWDAAHAPGEIFDLLRIRLEAPVGSPATRAWLYIAHNSPHRKELQLHEVIGPRIQGATPGARCRIHIERPHLTLPYREFPLVLTL